MKQILLAGGLGKRVAHILKEPKQFSRIIRRNNLLYSTFMLALERSKIFSEDILLVTLNENYLELAIEQINLILESNKNIYLIVEKEIKNTMFAIYNAINFIIQSFPNKEEKILISPCDHIINQLDCYKENIESENKISKPINLFGVKPDDVFNSTKYGNIFYNKIHDTVEIFLEKPKIEEINKIDHDLIHFWNSGIFLVDKNFIYHEIKKHLQIKNIILNYDHKKIENINFPLEKIFFLDTIIPIDLFNIPFDHLISRNAKSCSLREACFDWLDIGSDSIIKQITNQNFKGL